MRELFPPIEPYNTEFLDVGSGHKLYIEESGNPKGKPVLVLHGTGSGTSPKVRQYFDPEKIRLITFHQRGIGKSTFVDYLQDNTTQDQVKDIEKIREHLKVKKWHLSGGSWGCSLALAYAETHPDKVLSLMLRAVYLGQSLDNDWIYSFGANQLFPDKFEPLVVFCEKNGIESNHFAFFEVITGEDHEKAIELAKILSSYEGSLLRLITPPVIEPPVNPAVQAEMDETTLRGITIMLYYAVNECFLEDNKLIKEINKVRDIPAVIIHGRYDIVCPLIQAWQLHQAWPEAEFVVVPDAGHHHGEPGNREQIMIFADKLIPE